MLASSPAEAVQRAVYAALSGDAVLTGAGWTVADDTDTATYPYIAIGEGGETPRNAHDRFGREVVLTLHFWSAEHGFIEASRALDRAMALLDHRTLDLGQVHTAVACRFVTATRMRDPREKFVRHIAADWRITTEQIQ